MIRYCLSVMILYTNDFMYLSLSLIENHLNHILIIRQLIFNFKPSQKMQACISIENHING